MNYIPILNFICKHGRIFNYIAETITLYEFVNIFKCKRF